MESTVHVALYFHYHQETVRAWKYPVLRRLQDRGELSIDLSWPKGNRPNSVSMICWLACMKWLTSVVCYNDCTLQWRQNEQDGVWNHWHLDCLLNWLFKSKKTSKLRVIGLCDGNTPMAGGFPAQRASNAENVSIWWRHRDLYTFSMNRYIRDNKNNIGTVICEKA